MRDHPMIEEIERHGYPVEYLDSEESQGFDFYGTELFPGDDIAEIGNETIHIDNLERFLEDHKGFSFKTL
ncbi:YqaI family protein [Jeotgalibacillus haloalkalitolerans]|uniref:YqaI-like protein n=1 Tax=Jeotgalibacillus haloalkalitolerans TaxID=3104292 RepID=A0ABU5KK36_9BACL|nr:hypothetical protein [Jeotgalibacillus sp. HH7-29]MDZ5711620.1 hypothetical protein [Jeotgalibacillus sp. HH7-29]